MGGKERTSRGKVVSKQISIVRACSGAQRQGPLSKIIHSSVTRVPIPQSRPGSRELGCRARAALGRGEASMFQGEQ